MTKTQKRAHSKLDREWRTAMEIGETDSTMLGLAAKGLADVKNQHNARFYKRALQ